MDFHPDVPAESKSRGWNREQWVGLIPYGINCRRQTPSFPLAASILAACPTITPRSRW